MINWLKRVKNNDENRPIKFIQERMNVWRVVYAD
jgi:hypothetical protein